MSTDTPPSDPDRQECRACRGTGKVTSNKGGEPHTVDCPWCEGTGRFIPEHDAQGAQASEPPTDVQAR